MFLSSSDEQILLQAYQYWLNDMYLGNPSELPVNSNPGMVFPTRKFTTILDVARFTARLVDGAMNHKAMLDRKELPIERATSREKGQPLCMSQYYRVLGSCRIPGAKVDCQHIAPEPTGKVQDTEHVVVICRSQLYCVPVQACDRGKCQVFLEVFCSKNEAFFQRKTQRR